MKLIGEIAIRIFLWGIIIFPFWLILTQNRDSSPPPRIVKRPIEVQMNGRLIQCTEIYTADSVGTYESIRDSARTEVVCE